MPWVWTGSESVQQYKQGGRGHSCLHKRKPYGMELKKVVGIILERDDGPGWRL